MKPLRARLDMVNRSCREFWRKLAPVCGYPGCKQSSSSWRRLRNRPRTVLLQAEPYCHPECLEAALLELLRRTRSAKHPKSDSHRVPLGLLLLARQQLTAEQLNLALQAQRTAGHGRIGEWLRELGFVTESQVTAALACQWGCPVLKNSSIATNSTRMPTFPALLMESFRMVPVDFVEARSTLYVGFSERIDYTVLYAIEQMLGCRTEPCLIYPETLRQSLRSPGPRTLQEVIFDHISDVSEFARIVSSYASEMKAVEVRLARCEPHIWVRLLRAVQPALDLIVRSPLDSPVSLRPRLESVSPS